MVIGILSDAETITGQVQQLSFYVMIDDSVIVHTKKYTNKRKMANGDIVSTPIAIGECTVRVRALFQNPAHVQTEEGFVYFQMPKKNVAIMSFPLQHVILPKNHECTNRSDYLGIQNVAISDNKKKDVYYMRCTRKALDDLLEAATLLR